VHCGEWTDLTRLNRHTNVFILDLATPLLSICSEDIPPKHEAIFSQVYLFQQHLQNKNSNQANDPTIRYLLNK
jgi:hypothetical protein